MAEDHEAAGEARVRRRHVIYVPGYDPRGVAHYYRLFRAELGRFAKLHDVAVKVSRPDGPAEAHSTRWTVATTSAAWKVETTYELLRWDDIVQADAARAPPVKIARAFAVLARFLANGTFARLAAAHWRFGAFVAYPYLVCLALLAAAALLGGLVSAGVAALGGTGLLAAAAGFAAGLAGFLAAMRRGEPHSYMLYLFDDMVSTDEFARGRRADWEARLEAFSARIVAAAQAKEAEEIVIVGHSSGSFLAVDVLARALARDPALGRHGPRLTLLTLGANLPFIGFNPAARWFHDKLRRVVGEPDLTWLDVQSRKDVMSFFRFDQAAGHGIHVAQPNLRTLAVRFRDVVKPENYSRFRWRFFRVHFQYLMANERRATYDYFLMICGPRPLAEAAGGLAGKSR
jgi:predicted alpha/beta hydrolase family esterase